MALSDYSGLIATYAQKYGVDPKLLAALVQQESSGNPNAVGPKTQYGYARGLAGILDSTAQSNNVNSSDPAQSLDFAARTLAANLKQSGGDVPTALKMYHGSNNPALWGPKTAAYPSQVLAHYTKDAPDDTDLLNKLGNPSAAPPPQHDDPDLVAKLQGTPPTHAGWRANGTNVEWYDPNKPVAGTVEDTLKSGATGLVKGVGNVLGLPGDIRSLAQAGASRIADAIAPGSGPAASQAVNSLASAVPIFGAAPMPTSADINSGANALLGNVGLPFHTPQTIPGQYAETAGEFAPGVVLGGGGLATRIGRNVLAPAIGSETAGQLSDQNPIAKFAGGLAPSAAMSGARTLLGLGTINPARAGLADKAINQFGIDLRPSQITNQPFVKMLDSAIGKLPFSGLGPQNDRQLEQFSRAVAGTFGSNANNLTPEVMRAARERIGNVFDRVAGNTTIVADNAFTDKLFNVLSEAETALGDTASPIQKQVENIVSTIDKNGTISGKTYKALTSKNSPLDRGMSASDPNTRFYVGQLRDILDDALQGAAKPQDMADLRQARLQWKNMRTVQDIASKAGIEGEISPAALLTAVRKSYKDMAYSGAGDIGSLADIGSEFLKESPSSSTAERGLLYKLTHGLGGGAMGGAAGAFEIMHPEQLLNTAAGAAGLLVGGRMIGMGLKNKLYRNALLNAAVNPPPSGLGNQIPATLLGLHNVAQ